MSNTPYTYIMASPSGVLYIGVTKNLPSRVAQHKERLTPGFTQKYNVTKLVWCEPHSNIKSAIMREKEIKAWSRHKKIKLIEQTNRSWKDLDCP